MTQLYLSRHGETSYNQDNIEMGQLDIPLTDRGHQQSRYLAEKFSDIEIDAIYTSPLRRARKTGEIVASNQETTVKTRDGLKERNCGAMEGESTALIGKRLAEENCNVSTWDFNGGETRSEATIRARTEIENICQTHPDDTILIVAHGGVNKGILSEIISGKARYGHRLVQDLTCVNHLVLRANGKWRVRSMNETAHLE